MNRAIQVFTAAVFFGSAAYWFAIGIGLPSWRRWPPGDASDIGLFTALGVWHVLNMRRGNGRL